MKKFLFLLLAFACVVFGEESQTSNGPKKSAEPKRVLHVSTIPSDADIYVNQLRPNHRKNPLATSPFFIPITNENSQDNEILISLFKPEFTDTTIRVKLSPKDTSYLVVSLRPNYDKTLQEEQEKVLKKRYNSNFGKKMMLVSTIPFATSIISGIVTWDQIRQANDAKKKIENAPLGIDTSLRNNEENFKEHCDRADIGKAITNVGISLGASLLAVGIILQF